LRILQVKNANYIAQKAQAKQGVWIISCMYSQSQHAFTIQIPFMQTLSPAKKPWIAIIVAIAVLVALAGIGVVIRRRRRTAAIVAAILKQNRPIN
jgi:hypothetical protein